MAHWTLDPAVTFLNHGSFGACPRVVLERQSELRAQLEREPVRFFVREMEPLLDEARTALARFLQADPAGLAFVPNATAGVNTVLRSLRFAPGDELVVTDHEYNACRNALDAVAEGADAVVRVVTIPFPIAGPEVVTERILAAFGPRTRLLLLDHVTSPTALILPVAEIAAACAARGVDLLVDGAHAPGTIELDLDRLAALGVTYYTGNLHKWVCAPKGAGFLFVRCDRRAQITPLSTSHGRNSTRADRSRFHLNFDWTGTGDPTPYLCVPAALETMASFVPGAWPEIRARNHALVIEGRRLVQAALDTALDAALDSAAGRATTVPSPEEMLGSMASVPLPDEPVENALLPSREANEIGPLQEFLWREHAIEVPISPRPGPGRGRRVVRISAQLYNASDQYEALAEALVAGLRAETKR